MRTIAIQTWAEQPPKRGTRPILILWIGLLVPPIAWIVHLSMVYAAAILVCRGIFTLSTLHLMSAFCFGNSMIGTAISLRNWIRAGARRPDEEDDRLTRERVISLEGLLSGLLFSLVIAAQWLSLLYFSPCPSQ